MGTIRTLISAEEIAEKLAEMGAAITRDYQGKDLLVVGVLKGAFMVMADLVAPHRPPDRIRFHGGQSRTALPLRARVW